MRPLQPGPSWIVLSSLGVLLEAAAAPSVSISAVWGISLLGETLQVLQRSWPRLLCVFLDGPSGCLHGGHPSLQVVDVLREVEDCLRYRVEAAADFRQLAMSLLISVNQIRKLQLQIQRQDPGDDLKGWCGGGPLRLRDLQEYLSLGRVDLASTPDIHSIIPCLSLIHI